MIQYVEDGTLPPGLEDMLKSIKLFQYLLFILFIYLLDFRMNEDGDGDLLYDEHEIEFEYLENDEIGQDEIYEIPIERNQDEEHEL